MWTVLQELLASDSDRDVVDSAADALLPLILAFPAAFQRLGEEALTCLCTCFCALVLISCCTPSADVTCP